MTETETAVVWKGAEQLRPTLVPVESIHTHPRNPKKGNVKEIAASLQRFGQVRVILLDPDGAIVAGNHTFLAAVDLGWTHVSAVPNEFDTAEEARAYLLADNRLAELGGYDDAELRAHLEDLEAAGSWTGTGYVPDDLAHLRALEGIATAPIPDPEPVPPPVAPLPPPELREVVLLFTEEQAAVFAADVRRLRAGHALEGVTETVLRALKSEAVRLNQGDPE